jgi:hypothetical protein
VKVISDRHRGLEAIRSALSLTKTYALRHASRYPAAQAERLLDALSATETALLALYEEERGKR